METTDAGNYSTLFGSTDPSSLGFTNELTTSVLLDDDAIYNNEDTVDLGITRVPIDDVPTYTPPADTTDSGYPDASLTFSSELLANLFAGNSPDDIGFGGWFSGQSDAEYQTYLSSLGLDFN